MNSKSIQIVFGFIPFFCDGLLKDDIGMKHLFLVVFVAFVSTEVLSQERTDSLKNGPFIRETIPPVDEIKLEKQPFEWQDVPRYKMNSRSRTTGLLSRQFSQFNDLATDFTKVYKTYSPYLVPVSLVAYGILTQTNESLRELDYEIRGEVKEHVVDRVSIDDYLQFAPAVSVYGLDLLGIKAKHNLKDRTMVVAMSYLAMGVTVQTMKSTIHVRRPDNSNFKSFPSGHTATAFVGAHVLFREYRETSPWIGLIGYSTATATGVLRIVNNKHWLSDVAMGAGIGILSVELGYALLPVIKNLWGDKSSNSQLVIAPNAGINHYGVGILYTF